MRVTYDLYHWAHPEAAADIIGSYQSVAMAAHASGHPDSPAWKAMPAFDGWLLDPAQTGGKREWAIYARQAGETDAERAQLALELIASYGQDDGGHHKAWVIDQVARILTGDGYDAWIAAYQAGEDGPETYSWDTGIAP
jgi:hypothetical protein